MKQNKWGLPAVCACVAFFAGLIAGMSMFGPKRQQKSDAAQMADGVNEEISDAIEEECHNE